MRLLISKLRLRSSDTDHMNEAKPPASDDQK